MCVVEEVSTEGKKIDGSQACQLSGYEHHVLS